MNIKTKLIAYALTETIIFGFIILILLVTAICVLFWNQQVLKKEIEKINENKNL